MSVSQLLPYVLFLAISFRWTMGDSATSPVAIRADLTHVDSGRGFTKRELLHRMAARSTARVASRYSSSPRSHAVTMPVERGNPGKEAYNSEYNLIFGIGTPSPQPVVAELDTGSDLIWTQCGCMSCFDQPVPALDPSASRTFHGVPCSDPICAGLSVSGCDLTTRSCLYAYNYADKSSTFGTIAQDTFTFKDAAVPNIRFGCGQINHLSSTNNESGIAGFARGPLSLPSQLKVRTFSHCFRTIVEGRTSPVFLGTPDNLQAHATGPIQATPFVRNPASTLYYLSLEGISVGKKRMPFNASVFALNGDGSGGTIIDSGTSITSFPQDVFESIQEAFVSEMSLPALNTSDTSGLLCFSTTPNKAVPKLILHLEGADWDLQRENYVIDIEDDDGTGGGPCIVIGSSGEGNSITIIGNFQQQNMHIVYDLEANKLVFLPAHCDKM